MRRVRSGMTARRPSMTVDTTVDASRFWTMISPGFYLRFFATIVSTLVHSITPEFMRKKVDVAGIVEIADAVMKTDVLPKTVNKKGGNRKVYVTYSKRSKQSKDSNKCARGNSANDIENGGSKAGGTLPRRSKPVTLSISTSSDSGCGESGVSSLGSCPGTPHYTNKSNQDSFSEIDIQKLEQSIYAQASQPPVRSGRSRKKQRQQHGRRSPVNILEAVTVQTSPPPPESRYEAVTTRGRRTRSQKSKGCSDASSDTINPSQRFVDLVRLKGDSTQPVVMEQRKFVDSDRVEFDSLGGVKTPQLKNNSRGNVKKSQKAVNPRLALLAALGTDIDTELDETDVDNEEIDAEIEKFKMFCQETHKLSSLNDDKIVIKWKVDDE